MFDNNKCAVNYYLDPAPGGGGGPKIKSGNSENHWGFLKAKQITAAAIKYFIFPTSHSCVR